MPRDPSYVCFSRHMGAGCYESFFCNSLNNENHLEELKNYFFFFPPFSYLEFNLSSFFSFCPYVN